MTLISDKGGTFDLESRNIQKKTLISEKNRTLRNSGVVGDSGKRGYLKNGTFEKSGVLGNSGKS